MMMSNVAPATPTSTAAKATVVRASCGSRLPRKTVAAIAQTPVAHSHDAFDETIYGLEGVTRWTVGEQTTDVEPGSAVHIPRGVVHSFDNPSDVEARALAVVTPALLGPEYFHDLVAVVAAAAGGPPDLTAIADVMRAHGLTPAP